MIYTVTLNSSIDYFATSENFGTGKINRTISEHMAPGGKGINVSLVLNNLGQENIALGFVAGFTGRHIVKLLDEMGVNNEMIYTERGNSRINIKIKSPIDGTEKFEETDLNGMGPDIPDELIGKLYERLDKLSPEDILILSGGKTASMPSTIYGDIISRMNRKKIKTIVDASGALLENSLCQRPFLIKPNEDELCELCGDGINTDEDVIRMAEMLQKRGAQNILVSRGEKGAILLTDEGNIYCANAPQGKVVSTIGAGDSLLAGFIDGYIRTGNYEKALKEGICAGSASAFCSGLAMRDAIFDLYDLTL